MDNVKDRIVEKGREKFFSEGFSKVTMDEIALDLGISKKTFYKYFKSKDALLEAVVQRQILSISGQVQSIVTAEIDYIEKLHRLFTFMGNTIAYVSQRFQDDLKRIKPELWERIDRFRREKIFANFSLLLEEGKRKGMLRNDINKDIIILMFLTAVPGIINPAVLTRSSFSAEEAFTSMIKVFFEGVLTDEARNAYVRNNSLPSPSSSEFREGYRP